MTPNIHPRILDRILCAVSAVLVALGIGVVVGLWLRGL